MALTGKKRAFADAVLAGKSNKDAAIAAGYSVKTASPAGSRLAKDKDVVAHLARVKRTTKKPKFVDADGAKTTDAPKNWPFGTEPQSAPAPAVQQDAAPAQLTAEQFLRRVVNDETEEPKLRVEAAKKLIDFEKAKPAPVGKKDAALDAARGLAPGAAAPPGASRFQSAPPPRLAAVGGKKA